MKKIKLLKRDAYDLAAVMSTVIRENSEDLDFKDVIHIQKGINYVLDSVKDLSDSFDKLTEERTQLLDVANKKISSFKRKLSEDSSKKNEIDPDYKKRVEEFVEFSLDDLKGQIETEISPKIEELYDTLGEEEIELEFEEDKLKTIVINFEKYAKEKYTNKRKMVEVYEALTV